MQKDIDGNNENGKKYKPGQYFVLRFDFSTIQASPDLAEANENLIVALNSSFQKFYKTYAAYLGEDFTSLCGNIDSKRPSESLRNCNELVQAALSREEDNEELDDVRGIYLLVDEYDAFTNNYLETPNMAEPHKTTLDSTAVEYTFRSFWSTVKSLCSQKIERVFITGISPLSLSGIGSGFNVARNLSFHPHLAGLCGLTSSDLETVLEEICKDDKHDKHLSEMTKSFNGYHFCRNKTVETVYNTETCLAYLQSIVDGGDLET
jgi:Predicted AAA-ATPase